MGYDGRIVQDMIMQMLVLDRLARIEVSRERAFRKDEYLAKRKLWPQVVSA